MKRPIQRNHDAGTVGGAGNASVNLDGNFNLSGDDLANGKKGDASTGAPSAKTAEQIAAEKIANDKIANDLETAKKFGGTKLDDKGNVVDDKGTIIKTVEEINNTNSPEAVEIDNVKYALDKDGNALDKDGKIFKTAEEIKALEAEDVPLVDEIYQKAGVEIIGEDGKPKKYEDSIEGILSYTNDLAIKKAQENLKKFFDTYPELTNIAQHLRNGGNLNDFYTKQASSWKNFQFDEKNEEHLNKAVIEELVEKGMSKEQAEFTAKTYKDTDKLKEFGKAAYNRLLQGEIANEKVQQEQLQKQQLEEEAKVTAHWTNVENVIKTGKIDNITIPEAERQSFFQYVALAADENGNSKVTLDRHNLSIEKQLQLDYLIFKGFDLNKLVTNLVKSESVKKLRTRLGGNDKGLGGGNGTNTGNYKPNDVDVSMDNLNM